MSLWSPQKGANCPIKRGKNVSLSRGKKDFFKENDHYHDPKPLRQGTSNGNGSCFSKSSLKTKSAGKSSVMTELISKVTCPGRWISSGLLLSMNCIGAFSYPSEKNYKLRRKFGNLFWDLPHIWASLTHLACAEAKKQKNKTLILEFILRYSLSHWSNL